MTPPNKNIGHVACGFHGCDEIAAIRKDKKGQLYQECIECGRLRPSQAAAKSRILDVAVIWQNGTPPPGTPRWIAEQWNRVQCGYQSDKALEPLRKGETIKKKTPGKIGRPPGKVVKKPPPGKAGKAGNKLPPPPPPDKPAADTPEKPAAGIWGDW